jgi:leucyl-tRNA synthetase
MLAPFAPHLAEELWARLGKPYSIHQQSLPVASESLLEAVTASVAVQVNGRTRGLVQLPPDANEAAAVESARGLEVARQALERGRLRRVVYVPGRIINIVSA